MSFKLKRNKNEKSESIGKVENTKEKNIVSEEWLVVDKRETIKSCNCLQLSTAVNQCNKLDKELHVSSVLSKLSPFIPLSIEEASLTTSLESWTNYNVRLTGVLKFDGDKRQYLLESVNEADGMYKIVLDLRNLEHLPLLNECIQVFGKIKINFDVCGDDHIACPIVSVLFFRNMESGNLLQYMEAVEEMKSFIPLFIKTTNNDVANDNFVCNYNVMK